MYTMAQEDGTAGAAGEADAAADAAEDEVIDAEIVDEDESK
jgi:hypothetical protein